MSLPRIEMPDSTLIVGDVLAGLAELPAESVQCCVTSPPYWGLRAYGTEPQIWGGDQACEHQWTEKTIPDLTGGTKSISGNAKSQPHAIGRACGACGACGAWRGELGSEPTPEQFVSNMVAVFREVRRVLRGDGTCWVNIGDSYSTSPGANNTNLMQWAGINGKGGGRRAGLKDTPLRAVPCGLKPKDLCGIPWLLAFALRADGWYLRSEIIWHKPNPMPESVTDRPTKSHEQLFLLTKESRYFYDAEAVKESNTAGTIARLASGPVQSQGTNGTKVSELKRWGGQGEYSEAAGRNKRTVWTIATQPTPEAHFATFPEALVTPCILAGTSEKGCCPKCGKCWERVVERASGRVYEYLEIGIPGESDGRGRRPGAMGNGQSKPVGWQPACNCQSGPPIPCTVLEPFAGSGTTLAVSRKLGRRSIGIELNPEYAKIAEKKIRLALTERVKQPEPLRGQKDLFADTTTHPSQPA